MEEHIRTICQSCHSQCGVIVNKKDGKIISIEGDPNHPYSRGFICPKCKAQIELIYHEDRVIHPLKRDDEGKAKWKKISWNQALREISEKLTKVKEEYGQKSIASYWGATRRASDVSVSLLPRALGSPNKITDAGHICAIPSYYAEKWTYGRSITMGKGPDYENSNCIVVWGANPIVSCPPKGLDIIKAKREHGAKLIVVDPRKTELASKADIWLQIRPGVDDALALGWLNVIIEEELFDEDFVSDWCYGFDRLKERVREYSPKKVEKITWIPSEKIKTAARMYAEGKPSSLHHRVAIEQNNNSVQTARSLAILVAVTGNIDIKGGNLFPIRPEGYKSDSKFLGDRAWRLDEEIENNRIGSLQYPLASSYASDIPYVVPQLGNEAILQEKPYPIKAVFCAGANPAVNNADTVKTVEALKKLDLFVVCDYFLTPTAELADYVLPAAHWLEREEIIDRSYLNNISVRNKAIETIGECKHDLQIAIDLVEKIPWADRTYLPWRDIEEYNHWRVKDMDISYDVLKRIGTVSECISYKKYLKNGFDTPTNKVELYSTVLDDYGYDPLPHYRELKKSSLSSFNLDEDYPFILISGSKNIFYTHSEGRQLKSLREARPDPLVEIHPVTAEKLGIKEGDWVIVKTPVGEKNNPKFKVNITSDIHPKVVSADHGWWYPERKDSEDKLFDSNINSVLRNLSGDPICGSLTLRGYICRIIKL